MMESAHFFGTRIMSLVLTSEVALMVSTLLLRHKVANLSHQGSKVREEDTVGSVAIGNLEVMMSKNDHVIYVFPRILGPLMRWV